MYLNFFSYQILQKQRSLISYTRSFKYLFLDLDLKNYQEFGKIYVKNPLELDLKMNKVLNDSDLDIPFEFPK